MQLTATIPDALQPQIEAAFAASYNYQATIPDPAWQATVPNPQHDSKQPDGPGNEPTIPNPAPQDQVPNPQTKMNFVEERVAQYVKEVVVGYAHQQAALAAQQQVTAAVANMPDISFSASAPGATPTRSASSAKAHKAAKIATAK